jgi:S-adenosylmethionine uptake transporter
MVLMRDRVAATLRPRHPGWMAVRTGAVMVSALAGFHAFSVLPLAQTYAILFATPLLVTVLAVPLLGETVRLRRALAVLVGLGGVLIVLRPGAVPLNAGHLAALAAACGSALTAVVSRKVGGAERAAVMALYPMMANVVVMGAILPFVYQPMPLADLARLAFVALCALVAMLLVIQAYRLAEAVIVAPMQYSQILWAVLFGVLFFDEVPSPWTFAGASVVIASGCYIVLREARVDVSQTRPVLSSRARPATTTALPRGYPHPAEADATDGDGAAARG